MPDETNPTTDSAQPPPQTTEATGGSTAAAPLTEAVPPIDPSNIQTRETTDVYSQTMPLDATSIENIADHLADAFSTEVTRFVSAHAGMRPMITLAVHAGGALLHSQDVEAERSLARNAVTAHTRLEQYLRTRFPQETGDDAESIAMALLDKAFPRSAAEAGIAAAQGNRR